MTKILDKIKNNLKIFILFTAIIIIAAIAVVVFISKDKPVEIAKLPSSSEETPSSVLIQVPDIDVKEPVSTISSEETSSTEVDLSVEGNVASSAPAKPKPIVKPPVSSAPTKPPVSSTPVSSTPTTPPVSSTPITPPHNPNGPQHGDTDDFFGETKYYHIGIAGYIEFSDWNDYRFGQHPEATVNDLLNNRTKYLLNGDRIDGYVWCTICNNFVNAAFWDDGRHAAAAHK